MQVLEGPARGLARVYESIKFDSLHFGMIDLVREPIEVREFPEWSMAFRVAGAMGASSPTWRDELLSKCLSPSAGVQMSRSRGLLTTFWSKGRNSVVRTLIELSEDQTRRTHSGRIASRRTG